MQKLDFTFDHEAILAELDGRTWVPHSHSEWADAGNTALLLVTTRGEINHAFDDPMEPTADLLDMPVTRAVWSTLGVPFLRSRFMRIQAGGFNQIHTDHHEWWASHRRVHIPIKTNEQAFSYYGPEKYHLPAGSCWLFDTRNNYHGAENNGAEERIHLVIDVPR